MNPIPYGKQTITQQDIDAVVATLQHPFITQGPKVAEFEEAFAEYIGAQYAVAVANGTAALHLCALSLGVNEHSNVITSPITFAASANCIRFCGGNVYFADIDPKTILLDLEKVEALIRSRPKGFFQGIIPVDFAGHPVDMEAYRQLADKYGLWLIEDSCHSPGGSFINSKGQESKCGSGEYADLAIFSFHPVKHIASGEGGMITTSNKELYQKLSVLRTHGITKNPEVLQENHGGWYYEMHELGYNYRLTDIQSALGLSQLQRAEEGLRRRRELASRYDRAFSGTAVETFDTAANARHAYHLYVVKVNNRKEVYDALREKKIFTQVHYIPVHKLPYYQQLEATPEFLGNAEAYYGQCLSLPMYPALTNEEQDFVIENILEIAR